LVGEKGWRVGRFQLLEAGFFLFLARARSTILTVKSSFPGSKIVRSMFMQISVFLISLWKIVSQV
jgi:hypothetical protein